MHTEPEILKRGYIRNRAGGPSEDVQRAALLADGVPEAAIYVDGLTYSRKRQKRDTDAPLPQLELATAQLRPGDEIVAYDAGTLGRSVADITGLCAAVALRKSTLKLVSTGRTYRWHPDAAAIAALAKAGADQAASERTAAGRRKAAANGFPFGRPPVVYTPGEMARLRELWGDPTIVGKDVPRLFKAEFKKSISLRYIYEKLEMGRNEAKEHRVPRKKRKSAK